MQRQERESVYRETRARRCWRRIRAVATMLPKDRKKQIILSIYLLLYIWITMGSGSWANNQPEWAQQALTAMYRMAIAVCGLMGLFGVLILLGMPRGSISAYNDLQRAGLTNSMGEAPILVAKCPDKQDPKVTVMEFEASGIPRAHWEDAKLEVEAALNCYIASIEEGHNLRHVILRTVPAEGALPDLVEWKNEYLRLDSSTVVLGKGLVEQVTVDLAKIPHILIGGSTGSGKTILLKNILLQLVQKGARVIIADFKGGVDYGHWWHQQCQMCLTKELLLHLLDELLRELERRKGLLRESGCANIEVHRVETGEALERIIFACDEVAELLDKTGLGKEAKAEILEIENALSTIARQGRAFGIHLVLATQRPDANILSGQIRNNIDCRVCGRADNVLSQIILDCADAADIIPKSTQGRFLMYDGTVFQGYWINENIL